MKNSYHQLNNSSRSFNLTKPRQSSIAAIVHRKSLKRLRDATSNSPHNKSASYRNSYKALGKVIFNILMSLVYAESQFV